MHGVIRDDHPAQGRRAVLPHQGGPLLESHLPSCVLLAHPEHQVELEGFTHPFREGFQAGEKVVVEDLLTVHVQEHKLGIALDLPAPPVIVHVQVAEQVEASSLGVSR